MIEEQPSTLGKCKLCGLKKDFAKCNRDLYKREGLIKGKTRVHSLNLRSQNEGFYRQGIVRR